MAFLFLKEFEVFFYHYFIYFFAVLLDTSVVFQDICSCLQGESPVLKKEDVLRSIKRLESTYAYNF